MAAGQLRAVVCTSTLDLGIDWGDVDLVVNIGAPKGASRLAQRIGRANHRLDEPSKAILVPANRFEVLECRAALDANYLGAQDTPPIRPGALDVLAQHVLGMACAAPFDADALYARGRSRPIPIATSTAPPSTASSISSPPAATRCRPMNASPRSGRAPTGSGASPTAQSPSSTGSTSAPSSRRRFSTCASSRNRGHGLAGRGGRVLGKIEEDFIETLAPGDTFLFAGLMLRFEGIHENEAIATRTADDTPKIPVYAGGKFPLTDLSRRRRPRACSPTTKRGRTCRRRSPTGCACRSAVRSCRSATELLVETFPRGSRFYMVAYPFEGRLAHQTLGMLLTRRLERAGSGRPASSPPTMRSPSGGSAISAPPSRAASRSLAALFDEDMLGDDLEAWMADSYLLKRMFRNCALISGLIEKRHPGREKTGRQVTVSTDLIYDVLRRHEPDHILLRATWADAATGLLDIGRLGDMLSRESRGKSCISGSTASRRWPCRSCSTSARRRSPARRRRTCCARRRTIW